LFSADLVSESPSLRKVDLAEAKRYATTINATVMETSAKNGANVNEIFEQVVKLCLERQNEKNETTNVHDKKGTVDIRGKKKSSCC
jgi:hypothetical protein